MATNCLAHQTGLESFLSVRKNRVLIILLFGIAAFLIHIWQIGDFRVLIMSTDEAGYWGIAAYWAGLDWSGVMQHNFYYSYGYSFLLTPLFHLFEDPSAMYQAAIVLNGIMMAAIIPVAYQCGKQFFPKCSNWLLILAAFSVSVYSGYIVNTYIARNECLLSLLFWLLLLVFLQLRTDARMWKFILFAVLLGYSYMVHQRLVGVIIAAMIVLLCMCIKRHISIKQLLVVAAILIGMLFVHSLIKKDLQTNLWLNSDSFSTNDSATVLSRLQLLLTPVGIKQFLKVVSGQLFYLGAATFILFYFGLSRAGGSLLRRIKFPGQKSRSLPAISHQHWGLLLIALSFLLTICISAVFFIQPERLDQAMYGRYNEIVLGPVLLIGVLSLLTCSKPFTKSFFISVIAYIVLGVITYFATRFLMGSLLFFENCVPGIGWARGFLDTQWYLLMLIPGVVFFMFFALTRLKTRPFVFKTISLIFLSGMFFFLGYNVVFNDLLPLQTNIYRGAAGAAEALHDDSQKTLHYFVPNSKDSMESLLGTNHSYINHLQFLLPNISFQYVDPDDLRQLPEGEKIVALADDILNSDFFDFVEIEAVFDRFVIGTVAHSVEGERLMLQIPLTAFNTQNGIYNADRTVLSSDGQPGFLLYGPYWPAPADSYVATFTIEASAFNMTTPLVYVDVSADGTTYAQYMVSSRDFDTHGYADLTIPFVLPHNADNLELRLFTDKGAAVSVYGISLSMPSS